MTAKNIVWKGEGKLDAVLLRCPRPEKAQWEGWGKIVDTKPTHDGKWQSLGFSRATQYENLREPDNVSGTTESMADQADHFELTVNCLIEEPEMWRGVSGMPVFVDKEILGVVGYVPENFKGSKLYAVPSWKMFENEKFRKLIREFQKDSILKTIKKIEGLLNKSLDKDAYSRLVVLCKNENSCRKFLERVERICEQYAQLEKKRSKGSCDLSSDGVEATEIRIFSQLLLVDMKELFNAKSACLIYEKEALLLQKHRNKLRKRRIKIEDEFNLNGNPNNTEMGNILEGLRQTMKYLHQTINSFLNLIKECQAVKSYE